MLTGGSMGLSLNRMNNGLLSGFDRFCGSGSRCRVFKIFAKPKYPTFNNFLGDVLQDGSSLNVNLFKLTTLKLLTLAYRA